MNHTCPHCGALLHEDASFCPHCARSINSRMEPVPPRPVFGKAFRTGVTLLVMAGIALGIYMYHKPLVLDGVGEVIYTDVDGKYQVVLAYDEDRHEPAPVQKTWAELDGEYIMPSRLYVNLADSGADANRVFLKKVESVTTQFIQPADSVSPMGCSKPAYADHTPNAALVSSLSFTGRSGTAELLWTIKMKNGDTILLRQEVIIEPIETYDYYPEDVDMNTIEELQALVSEIEQTIDPMATVNIHLPPVVYDGGLIMEERPVNLYGSADGENRTTFTDTIRVAAKNSYVFYFEDIDFAGGPDGVGISASARLHIINCTVSGWKTGVLSYGNAWVLVAESRIEDNGVGFHFNSEGNNITGNLYTKNRFIGNGTAVMLERVPSDVILNFSDSLFFRNDKDIDNLCDQPIDISEAIFQ